MSDKIEKVLVIPGALVTPYLRSFADGACFDYDVISDFLENVLNPNVAFYMNRAEAEVNPAFKQIIPYTTIWRNEKVFVYERGTKGGEARLYNRWSLGIGGHVNPVDGKGDLDTYEKAFWREIKEETGLARSKNFDLRNSIRGLIYDDSNDVGKVHFGIIHYLDLIPAETMYFADKSLLPVGFMNDEEVIKNFNLFENWSKIATQQFRG